MQEIPLPQGTFALVHDDADFPLLSDFRWRHRGEKGKEGYAVGHTKVDGKDRLLYLHRRLMQPLPDHEVIIRNADTLDCRRENLRVVTRQEARQHHLRARSNSASGVKGIRYNRRPNTWSVDVYRDGQLKRVGTFLTQKEALDARQRALQLDNPDLHAAPARVERPAETAAVQLGDPDAA